ncbi:uncharacterized protein LOC119689602 [Teleopsis dalmanni]|uniref:uncharacterized protein LOC119689602 n=1 Tax=Teleopsis dalmanni TaxID=139649 RepID=UPI0018CE1502|nr:uncharacterized protein LOC119689602 [Teleopsis dalmanni]XP_037960396.1 uncharacterized protein LOC119689602 [Teleopsis dalmanni]
METQSEPFIEACRLCGVYYTNPKFLRSIFEIDVYMFELRYEFVSWNLRITENDGYPQNICETCIQIFKEILKFRESCINTQNHFRETFKEKVPTNTDMEFLDLDDDLSSRRFLYEHSDNENDEIPSIEEEFTATTTTINDIKPIQIEEMEFPGININNEIIDDPLEEILFEYRTEEALPAPSDNEFQYLNESEKKPQEMEFPGININNEIINDPWEEVLFEYRTEEALPAPSDNEFQYLNESEKKPQEMEFPGININNEIIDDPLEEILFEYRTEEALPAPSDNEFQYLNESENHEHEIKNYDCRINSETFDGYEISENLKCPQCEFRCSSKALLKQHTCDVHSKVSCKLCGISVFRDKLNAHMKETHSAPAMKCMTCNMNYDSRIGGNIPTDNSIDEQHPVRLNDDNAPADLVITNLGFDLHTESMRYFNGNLYICPVCDEEYITQLSFEVHLMTHIMSL